MSSPGRRLAGMGVAILFLFSAVAVLAPALAPHDPRALSGDPLQPPSADHPLGTNDIGQDVASEVIWGARTSLVVAVGAGVIAVGVAVLIGVGAALAGGWVDSAVMRLLDVLLAVPVLPLLVLVAALAGPSRTVVVVVIGLLAWPRMARILRSQTLSLRQRGYVEAAQGLGGGFLYVLRCHLVPALAPLLAANFVIIAGVAVLLEAGLAFLGLGDPTAPSWGQILHRALDHPGIYFTSVWMWWVLAPGIAITVAILGFTFLAVGLEPRFNPRWDRGR